MEISLMSSVELIAPKTHTDLQGLTEYVRVAENIGSLHDVRSRLNAAKQWAKVHNKVRELRLDLLRLEIEALVRIIQLGGGDTLGEGDRKAAEWLADMSIQERESFVEESRTATTAAGMCRSAWNKEAHESRQSYGGSWAEDPEPPPPYDEETIWVARYHTAGVESRLQDIAETYMESDKPFTIEEVTDELLEEVGGSCDVDDAFKEGVREVVRHAIRSEPPLSVDGTLWPRVITVRLREDGCDSFVRIPTKNATVAQAQDFLKLRLEGLATFQAAVERVRKFVEQVESHPSASANSRIGDLAETPVFKAAA